jgi:UDP-N-acetylglucosamine:LPS N-acetylglucosamine transferase
MRSAAADHHRLNADAYAVSGAARMVPDRELDAARLGRELAAMLADEPYARLRAAARALADTDPRAVIVARVKRFLSSNSAPP